MIEKVKRHMGAAYNHMRSMTVSHDNVKVLAMAEQELEEAFKILWDFEEATKQEEEDRRLEAKEEYDGPDPEVTANG